MLSKFTIAWIVWVVWFVVWETWALLDPAPDDTLTEHIRPLIHGSSFGWFLGSAFALWLVWHFLVEGEGGLHRWFGG